jgi:hypothetical protein
MSAVSVCGFIVQAKSALQSSTVLIANKSFKLLPRQVALDGQKQLETAPAKSLARCHKALILRIKRQLAVTSSPSMSLLIFILKKARLINQTNAPATEKEIAPA